MGILGTIFLLFFVVPIVWEVLKGVVWALFEMLLDLVSEFGILYLIFFIIFLPFRILNWLQLFLHCPWRGLMKRPVGSDRVRAVLRVVDKIARFPLYIALTPLRFVNAVAFNLGFKVLYELWNYICEVFFPSDRKEGERNFGEWLLYFPYRIVKYLVYHWLLTVIECVIYTLTDTLFPTVTLYHGTSAQCAQAIVQSPSRRRYSSMFMTRNDGIWKVGGGNYAGDGIYFAPRSSTAMHYSRRACNPVVIICRVTLGKLLPMGLSPDYIYYNAGNPDAHRVTSYGLNNGYKAIEWWRVDGRWWEYCLLDWQNKYNESWRIRPIMVLNPQSYFFKRTDGGSRHWLFDQMILNDLSETIFG